MEHLNRLIKDKNTGLIYRVNEMEFYDQFVMEVEFRSIDNEEDGLIEEYDTRKLTFEDMLRINDLELIEENSDG